VAITVSALGGLAMQFRIGSRDPITGLYNVIYPDGSSTPNGIKIYNSAHRIGDPVSATKRGDGMIILDNPKAADPSSLTVSAAGNRDGYLNGQVFNGDEEDAVSDVLIFRYVPKNDSTGNHLMYPKLYCSNTRREEITIDTVLAEQVQQYNPGLIYLDAIPGVYAEIQANASNPSSVQRYPGYSPISPNDYLFGIVSRQINFATARKICIAQSCRYLICGYAGYSAPLSSASASFGTFSAQVGNYMPDLLPFDYAEYDRPYVLGARKLVNWTNWRWLMQLDNPDGALFPFVDTFACFVQVDTQNPSDIIFLNPVFSVNSSQLVIQSRPQVIYQ
jgi:hypothetical protein